MPGVSAMIERLSSSQAEQLTSTAFDILISHLEQNGNQLSDLHRQALQAMLEEMTGYATGAISGRRAFSLGTGCGKTSAIIAWITALHRLGFHWVSVSVSASKVEALCDLKRQLMLLGVPERLIGIKHSVRDASLPSTDDDDRRYQLVTHARVRGGNDKPLFVEHQGQTRALMIYDESLIRSDSEVISERTLRMETAALKEHVRGREIEALYQPLFGFLDEGIATIREALHQYKGNAATSPVITVDAPEWVDLDGFRSLLGKGHQWETIQRFLDVVGSPLRLLMTKQDEGLVWYQISVPPELSNILILDASYPIRELVKMDSSILDSSPAYIREVKRFDRVAVYQMKHPSGRQTTSDNFGKRWLRDRTMSREITQVVERVPQDKSILIFTFKPRANEIDIPSVILRDLEDAGIDTKARTPDGNARINILTWGDETSLNQFSHCEVVILAGLLHLPHLTIASRIIGQQDSYEVSTSHKQVEEVLDSEIAHSVYQAISRGACRVVENGQAKAMEVYLFHSKANLQGALQSIMPGLKWHVWVPSFAAEDSKLSEIDIKAMAIKAYLDKQPEDRLKVSTKEIREALSLDTQIDKVRKLYDRAIQKICCSGLWQRQGQSLVRMGYLFGC